MVEPLLTVAEVEQQLSVWLDIARLADDECDDTEGWNEAHGELDRLLALRACPSRMAHQ